MVDENVISTEHTLMIAGRAVFQKWVQSRPSAHRQLLALTIVLKDIERDDWHVPRTSSSTNISHSGQFQPLTHVCLLARGD